MKGKEKILLSINDLIGNKCDDNYRNHLKSWLRGNGQFNGLTTNDSFVIWRCHHFWTGIMFPIIYGNFSKENDNKLNLKSRINKIGLFFSSLLFVLLSIGIYLMVTNDGNFIKAPFVRMLAGLFLLFAFSYPLFAGYGINKQIIIHEIEKIVKKANES